MLNLGRAVRLGAAAALATLAAGCGQPGADEPSSPADQEETATTAPPPATSGAAQEYGRIYEDGDGNYYARGYTPITGFAVWRYASLDNPAKPGTPNFFSRGAWTLVSAPPLDMTPLNVVVRETPQGPSDDAELDTGLAAGALVIDEQTTEVQVRAASGELDPESPDDTTTGNEDGATETGSDSQPAYAQPSEAPPSQSSGDESNGSSNGQ